MSEIWGNLKPQKTLKPRDVIASVTRKNGKRLQHLPWIQNERDSKAFSSNSGISTSELPAKERATATIPHSLASCLPSLPFPHKPPEPRSEIQIYVDVEIRILHLRKSVDSGMFLLVEALARSVRSQVSFVDGRFCVCT